MSFKPENDEILRLAEELANLTGETVDEAVVVALRERLERVRHERSFEARLQKIRAITERTSRMVREGTPVVDHGELLYDERGLPK